MDSKLAEYIRTLPLEATTVVSMPVKERVNRSGGANGMRFGWECAMCQTQTGLQWDLEHVAADDLAEHLRTEHPSASIGVCECRHTCLADPATACSLSGDWHLHTGERCPVHPEAEVTP